jgi:hypothetical protein
VGRVRYRRSFGRPRELDPQEHVWLTFERADIIARVWLNDQFLGQHEGHGSFEFEVTPLLLKRNELVVEVESQNPRGGLWGEVALEIRRAAFLRSVSISVCRSGEVARLRFTGEVVGESERPLEIYGVLGRSTVAYATVTAAQTGAPFEILSEVVTTRHPVGTALVEQPLRLDLIDAAVVWYSVEQLIDLADS